MYLEPFSTLYRRTPEDTWQYLLAGGQQVRFDDTLGVWLIIGHGPVRDVLNDPTRFSNADTLTPLLAVPRSVSAILAHIDVPPVALTADPPTHARTQGALRSVMPHTAARVTERWSGVVRYRVEQLLHQVAANTPGTSIDLVEQFTGRLPLLVLLDIIGIPVRDAHRLRDWTTAYLNLLGGQLDPAAQRHAAQCLDAMWRYCRSVIATRNIRRGGEATDDLISRLLRYRAGDDTRLTEAEVAALTLNLLLAGVEPTAALLSHTIQLGLTDPHRWARLSTDPGYAGEHVEETLRHRPAVDAWMRTTTAEVSVAGVTIPAAARCLLLIGTANHDPTVFTDPQMFDPDRAWAGTHLSFGAGAHHCVGAGLARLQAITAVTALARRLPHLRLPTGYQPWYRPNALLRNHLVLPAAVSTPTCPVHHTTRTAAPS